jgi:hypothetical protein
VDANRRQNVGGQPLSEIRSQNLNGGSVEPPLTAPPMSELSGRKSAVSDVVTRGDVPTDLRQNMLVWVGCIAGALGDYEYVAKLAKAGFDNIDIEPTRVYEIEDARTFLGGQGVDVDAIAPQMQGKFMSAFIRATKPASCCAPGCCA